MGGNKRKGQRTKNNARPSSSGRSAELLGHPARFVGFSGVTNSRYIPTPSDQVDACADQNFQNLFKKMGKKDPITKRKAMQEFTSLVNTCDVNTLKTILPYWPRVYCSLAVDVNHRVREAAQVAQCAIVNTAKREIAPILKQIAPTWFTSQFDSYRPAASAAQTALKEAFSTEKLASAIVHCQDPLLAYINDILTNPSPEILSNCACVLSEQDLAAKVERLVVCCLHCYAWYLTELSSEQLSATVATSRRIVACEKFWEYSNHASSQVRIAWFELIYTVCDRSPELLLGNERRVCTSVLAHMDDTDSSALPVIWKNIMKILETVENCWSHIDTSQVLIPKLLNVLSRGAGGNAQNVYKNLMPLIKSMRVACQMLPNEYVFFTKLLSSYVVGFRQRAVYLSRSESVFVALQYIDCVQYIFSTLANEEHCLHLFITQVLPALGHVIQDDKLIHMVDPFLCKLSRTLHSWSQNRGVELNRKLLEHFWKALLKMYGQLLDEPGPTDHLLQSQVHFLRCIKQNEDWKPKVKSKVKFNLSDGTTESSEDAEARMPEIDDHQPLVVHKMSCLDPGDKDLQEELRECAQNLFLLYYRKISLELSQSCSSSLVHHLHDIARCFDSEMFWLSIGHCLSLGQPAEGLNLLINTFQTWLKDMTLKQANVVRLLYMCQKHVRDQNEKNNILTSVFTHPDSQVQLWCVTVLAENAADEAVRQWLRSRVFTQELTQLVDLACTQEQDIYKVKAIHYCLSAQWSGDLLIDPAAVEAVLKKMEQIVINESAAFETVAQILHSVCRGSQSGCKIICGSSHGPVLALKLFEACLSPSHNAYYHGLIAAWRATFEALAKAYGPASCQFRNIITEVSQLYKRQFFGPNCNALSVEQIQHYSKMGALLVHTSTESAPEIAEQLILLFGSWASDMSTTTKMYTAICLRILHLLGKLSFVDSQSYSKFLCSKESEMLTTDSNILESYVTVLVFNTVVLQELLEGVTICRRGASVILQQALQPILMDIFYNYCVCHTYMTNLSCITVYTSDLQKKYYVLTELLKDLVERLDNSSIQEITIDIINRALSAGGLWATLAHLWKFQILNFGSSAAVSELIDVSDRTAVDEQLPPTGVPEQNTEDPDDPSDSGSEESQASDVDSEQLINVNFDDEDVDKCCKKSYGNVVEGHFVDARTSSEASSSNSDTGGLRTHVIEDVYNQYLFSGSLTAHQSDVSSSNQSAGFGHLHFVQVLPCEALYGEFLEMSMQLEVHFLAMFNAVCYNRGKLSLEDEAGLAKLVHRAHVIFCPSSDAAEEPWDQVQHSVEIIKMLRFAIRQSGLVISRHWDWISLWLVKWIKSVIHHKADIFMATGSNNLISSAALPTESTALVNFEGSHKVGVLAMETVRLFVDILEYMECGEVPSEVLSEWNEIFLNVCGKLLVELYEAFAGYPRQNCLAIAGIHNLLIMKELSNCLLKIDIISLGEVVKDITAPAESTVEHCIHVLVSSPLCVQLPTYIVLCRMAATMARLDQVAVDTDTSDSVLDTVQNDHYEDTGRGPIVEVLHVRHLDTLLSHTEQTVKSVAAGCLGTTVTVQPNSHNFHLVSAYLLSWSWFLELCSCSSPEVRYLYGRAMESNMRTLLEVVFQFFPQEVLAPDRARNVHSPVAGYFTSSPPLNVTIPSSSVVVEWACWLYFRMVQTMPVIVRKWFEGLDLRDKNLVENVNKVFVGPALCQKEMDSMRENPVHENMSVSVLPNAREVVAVYRVEDASMELTIKLPTNYPLGLVRVDATSITNNTYRQMAMQVVMFLTQQNGSVLDGLMKWKNNLDKKFQGVAECCICYYVVHGSILRLPNLSCSGCKNKFHSTCLYQWFKTGNNATCPICRNMF